MPHVRSTFAVAGALVALSWPRPVGRPPLRGARTGWAAVSSAAVATPSIDWGQCSESDCRRPAHSAAMSRCRSATPTRPGRRSASRSRGSSTPRAPLNYQGVIITSPGGPGGSGLDFNMYLIPVLRQEGFNAAAGDYDWIGFDPRGVGSSKPTISCKPDYFSPDRPNYVPWTPSLLGTWETRSQGYAAACASQSAEQTQLLHNMTTVDNAKDVNSIREALGVSQITYYGFSWGTDLGQTYASLFPNTLRRLILDSNVNMTRPGYDDFNLDQDPPFNTNEDKWFAWLAQVQRRVPPRGHPERGRDPLLQHRGVAGEQPGRRGRRPR